jgi:hypothetical protein
MRWKGFAVHAFRRGVDYVGNPVAEETLMRTYLLADVGQAWGGSPGRVFAGLGYEFWRNKYGARGVPGTDTDAPTLHLEFHF